METTSEQIISYCEAEWETWKSDCSGFVKAVATDIGVPLSGQANSIIGFLDTSVLWEQLGSDTQKAI